MRFRVAFINRDVHFTILKCIVLAYAERVEVNDRIEKGYYLSALDVTRRLNLYMIVTVTMK